MPHYEGPCDAKIAIVGEALGRNEALQGRPFVGAAGMILTELLNIAGISRSEVYITNTFSFQPPNNRVDRYIRFDSNGACIFESPEYHREKARLAEELSSIKANVIIPLGNIPLYTLCGTYGITKWRGSILESSLLKNEGRKCIPTIHTAAVKRGTYSYRYYIIYDFAKAKKEAETPDLNLPRYTLHLYPSFDEAVDFIRMACKQIRVGTDIESIFIRQEPQHNELTHFSIATSEKEAMCFAVDDFTPLQEGHLIREYSKLLGNEHVTKVGQRFFFDQYYMTRRYGIHTRCSEDTFIAQGILTPDHPRDLGFLCSLWTRQAYYKDDRKLNTQKQYKDETRFRRYNCLDSLVVLPIISAQKRELKRMELLWYFYHKCNLVEALVFMQHHGLFVDKGALRKLSEAARGEMEEIQRKVDLITKQHLNINSPKQLMNYFYIEKGYTPYKKDGKPTADADAMIRLEQTKKAPEARLINKYRSLSTLDGTFYTMQLDPDDHIRCEFNPIGGGISRLSSKKSTFGTGMNMQNLPPSFKEAIVAPDGFWILDVDLAQAEDRVVAYLWDVVEKIKAYQTGQDPHKKTAALIFKKAIDLISTEVGSTTIGGGKYSERDIGKRANHAKNYDLGIDTFAIKNEMTRSESAFIHDAYFKAYPEIKHGHAEIQFELRHTRLLVDLLGRKARFYGPIDDDLFKQGYAFKPQSTIGNLMNMYGLQYVYDAQRIFHDFHIVNQVHDSLWMLFPKAKPLSDLANGLLHLRDNLGVMLVCPNGNRFSIPLDLKIGKSFGKGGAAKVQLSAFENVKALAEELEEVLYPMLQNNI